MTAAVLLGMQIRFACSTSLERRARSSHHEPHTLHLNKHLMNMVTTTTRLSSGRRLTPKHISPGQPDRIGVSTIQEGADHGEIIPQQCHCRHHNVVDRKNLLASPYSIETRWRIHWFPDTPPTTNEDIVLIEGPEKLYSSSPPSSLERKDGREKT
jgi:hypothetical protein